MKLSTCQYCNRIFTRARNTKQFCALECKNKYNYAKRNNEETPLEIYQQLIDDTDIQLETKKSTEEYLDRIKFLEQELAKKNNQKNEHTSTGLPTKEIIKPIKTVKQKSKTAIPFLAKKERIIEQLINEEIEVVTKNELDALGYPLGFFDGWSEGGEVLVKYKIEILPSGVYQIKTI